MKRIRSFIAFWLLYARRMNRTARAFFAGPAWKPYALILSFMATVALAFALPKPKGPQVWTEGQVHGLAAPFTTPSQINYNANATGSVSRKIADKLGDVVHCKDYGSVGDGVTNDVVGITAAIAALPSYGGIVDCRSLASPKFSTPLTISKNGTVIKFPSGTIALGTNQIVISPAADNVALIGTAPYGSAGAQTAVGTVFTYTGTGAALVVGDSTVNTNGFLLQDITVEIPNAGSAAIGIQLNRATFYNLIRPRVQGTIGVTTQKDIDLEGYTDFTGGYIEACHIDNGNSGIYFGKNANANMVIGCQMAFTGLGNGIGYNLAGDVTGPIFGTVILGGDIENMQYVFRVDYCQNMQSFGVRSENGTSLVQATANSVRNMAWSNGATPNTETDLGNNNSFMTTPTHIFQYAKWWMRNQADVASVFEIGAGSASEQFEDVQYDDKTGTSQWVLRKDTNNGFAIRHTGSANINRIQLRETSNGNTAINAENGGVVAFNSDTNSSTGGVVFYGGGGSPALGATIGAGGKLTTYNAVSTAANGVPSIHGTPVLLTAQTADKTATNVYASAPAGEYRVCATARTTTSGSGTTSTLNIIWTDEGGVKTDAVGTWALNSVTVTGQINKCEFIHAAASTNIQVSTSGGTYGTSVYALSATAERLN